MGRRPATDRGTLIALLGAAGPLASSPGEASQAER